MFEFYSKQKQKQKTKNKNRAPSIPVTNQATISNLYAMQAKMQEVFYLFIYLWINEIKCDEYKYKYKYYNK